MIKWHMLISFGGMFALALIMYILGGIFERKQ